jgi:cysteine desulfuration protein SufE
MTTDLPRDADELVENFALFDDWEDRYGYLVDLGEKLPPLSEGERIAANKVTGCMSQVWFVRRPSVDGRLVWEGDSDASIVKGLIAVLQVVYGGKTHDQAREIDVNAVFERLGLERHLSMNRRNGFFSMVSKLQEWSRG